MHFQLKDEWRKMALHQLCAASPQQSEPVDDMKRADSRLVFEECFARRVPWIFVQALGSG